MAVTFIWITFYDDQREHRYVPRSQRRFRPGMLAGWLAYLTSWIKKWLTILVTVIHNSYIFTSVGYLLTWLKTHINNAQQSYQKCCHERARRRRVRHTMKDYSHRSRPRRRWSTTVSRRMAILTAMHAVVALSAATPAHGFTAQFDTDSSRVGIDNRCSACISDQRSDFKGNLRKTNRVIKGFGGHLIKNVWTGTLVWTVEDNQGCTHTWHIPGSYFVPDGGVRLFSPQHWAQTRNDNKPKPNGSRVVTNSHDMVVEWDQRKHKLTVPIDQAINVGTFHLAPGYSTFKAFSAEAGLDDDLNPVCYDTHVIPPDYDSDDDYCTFPTDEDMVEDSGGATPAPTPTPFDLSPDNITTEHVVQPDEEDLQQSNQAAQLLRFHHRYNHISFSKLQHMARRGIIPKKLATCEIPMCSACLYGKATRRPWRSKQKANQVAVKPKAPGEVIAVDQMTSPTAGLIAQMAGFITKKRYKYATVFVDHATGFGYVHIQKTQSAEETLEAKVAFEKMAAAHGVRIQNYHADNGVFASQLWRQHCSKRNQGLTFAGVGAHHMNGRAERRIRELQELSRTMLIHANKRWPEAVDAHLWPYAVRMANDAYNEAMARDGGKSPLERFSKSNVEPNTKFWQPFGCPVFVLDAELQSGKGIMNKWKERSKIGIYLGRSPHHARSVALVLNLKTGHVSPQFHVMFDPSFQTIKPSFGGGTPISLWQSVCGFVDASEQQQPTQSRQANRKKKAKQQTQRVSFRDEHPGLTLDTPPNPTEQREDGSNPSNQADLGDNGTGTAEPSNDRRIRTQTYIDPEPQTTAVTASGRAVRAPQRLLQAMVSILCITARVSEGAIDARARNNRVEGEIFCMQALFPDDEVIADQHPLFAYGATNDPDTLYWHEAMRAPDAEQFKRAMEKEFNDQMANDNFSIIHKSEVPEGENVLPSVWAMRRKRRTKTGEIYKWKARLNMDGSRQRAEDFVKHSDDFWQTYSPVATWASIRLMLNLSLQQDWYTVQLDFVQAYPQAPISKVQYMKMPKGIEIDGVASRDHVLKVTKNVYGGRDAGRTWNKYLLQKLFMIGFKQSKFDECVFYKGKTMYILYTDDSILGGPDKAEIDSIIKQMKGVGLDITVEGDVSDFLGVHIERNKENNTFELTQPMLIQSILSDLGLDKPNSTIKDTPAASSKLLSRHPNSECFDNSFHYRRAIGKMNFLEKSTRADLAYAVHQCARFSIDPKVEHGKAVKWIGRYLLGTKDKGIIMSVDPSKGLEVYVDADFTGAWDKELAGQDIDTARSRHGFVIMYAGTPVVWQSQLQTEIALSSTESELIGMSMALRSAIPLMGILNEMKEHGFKVHPATAKVHCKVFEDNNGALAIAQVPKIRPRTKHINCKYFHFNSYVESGAVTLHRIDTSDQPADTLTKANDVRTLVKHRKFILGW